MIQRHVSHPPGRFARCAGCNHEPRHIAHLGRTANEPYAGGHVPARHALECRCGRATGKHATVEAAERDWGVRFSQMDLTLDSRAPSAARRTPRHMEALA